MTNTAAYTSYIIILLHTLYASIFHTVQVSCTVLKVVALATIFYTLDQRCPIEIRIIYIILNLLVATFKQINLDNMLYLTQYVESIISTCKQLL